MRAVQSPILGARGDSYVCLCCVVSECGGGLLSVAAGEGARSHGLRRQPQKGRANTNTHHLIII